MSPTIKAFVRYTMIGGVSRGFQTAGLFVLVEWMGVNYIVASLAAVAIVHVAAFAIHTAWTFKPVMATRLDRER